MFGCRLRSQERGGRPRPSGAEAELRLTGMDPMLKYCGGIVRKGPHPPSERYQWDCHSAVTELDKAGT